ncbi:putative surface layer protein [unidentified eubacterium SCB49]|nr:putative surface layer protein [unidentified eubacterium SCB49]
MKKIQLNKTILLSIICLAILSCTSDDRDDPVQEVPITGDYTQGLFVLNEGGYGSSNASVSFLDNEGQLYQSIFAGVNDKNLGDTAQSMGFNEDYGYIVVNNSSTVEVVDRNTFTSIATVTSQIVNPRYIAFSDSNGFITNWGDPNDPNDDYVAVLNLETNLVESKIIVSEGPEKMVVHNGKLFVAQKGGYGYGNTITVIDLETQLVVSNIEVSDVPTGMVISDNSLYVLCAGKAPYTGEETQGALYKINANTYTTEASLSFPEGVHPSFLELDNNTLYFTQEGSVYAMTTANFQLPTTPIFEPALDGLEILYGFTVAEGLIYLADAKDYASNGETFIYNLNGALQQQFTVAIIPNSFYFNN